MSSLKVIPFFTLLFVELLLNILYNRYKFTIIDDGYLYPDLFIGDVFYGLMLTEKGQRAYEEYQAENIRNVSLTVAGIIVAVVAIVVPILLTA